MSGKRELSSVDAWRKIAGASWGRPLDPQIFGDIEVDAGALLTFLEAERARSGVHVTVTHLVGKALAHALAENPDVNVRLRRGRFVPRESVDVFFVVALSEGKELSSFPVGPVYTMGAGIDVTADGRALVPLYKAGKIVEFSADGKQLWEATLANPVSAVRLPNGHVLATSLLGQRVVELNRGGQEVWSFRPEGRPWKARKR